MKRLILGVSLLAAVAGCNRASSTPAGVAEEFMRKMDRGDCTGIGDYLAASSKAIAPKLEQGCAMQAQQKKTSTDKGKTLASVNVLEATENGDRATVRLEGVFSDGSKQGGEDALPLVREDGRWKIDLLAAMGGGMGGGGMSGPAPAPPMTPPATMPAAPTMTPGTPPAPAPAEAPDEAETPEPADAEK